MNAAPVRTAVFWSFGAQYIAFAIQFVTSVILARWFINPEQLGLFSIAFAAVSLMTFLQDFGITRYITGERELTEHKIRGAFTVSLAVAWSLAALATLMTWPIAHFYALPGLMEVMLVVASSYFVAPFVIIPRALCQRRLDFRSNATIELGSCLLNAAVALALAMRGHGALALAWGAFAQQSGRFAICLLVARPVWYRLTRPTNVKPIAEVGGTNTVLSISGSLVAQAPELVIGRLLGASPVGLFTRAAGLAAQLQMLITGGASAVFYPAFRQVRDSGHALGPAYLRVAGAFTAVTWPAMTGLAVLSTPLIRAIYGDHWAGAAPLLAWIAMAQLCYCSVPLRADLPILLDRKRDLLIRNIIDAVLSVALLLAAAPFGLQWVAASRLLHGLLWFAIYAPFICALTGLAASDLFRVYRSSLFATIAAIMPALVLNLVWESPDRAGFVQVVVAAMLGVLTWFIAIVALRHPLREDIARIVVDLRAVVSRRMTRRA